MRVLITTVQVPFVRGGAEILAEGLKEAIRGAGHEAEIVAIPFKWYPPTRLLDHMLACRLLDVSEVTGTAVDRVIGLKFPAYLIPHHDKVYWIIHQHRTAYEQWDGELADMIQHPEGPVVRDAVRHADIEALGAARGVYTIAMNVSRRLKKYCGIDSTPMYHPPLGAEHYYSAPAEDYLLFPSRLSPDKRQGLVLEALALTRQQVQVRFAGTAGHPPHEAELKATAERLGVAGRVEWLGAVSEEQKRAAYARALGVVYPPVDEDYGYVTLEAMLASKPVITCSDSGGPLEFVEPGRTGLVADPSAGALADAMDEIWAGRELARAWGEAGKEKYDSMGINWPTVVERLLS